MVGFSVDETLRETSLNVEGLREAFRNMIAAMDAPNPVLRAELHTEAATRAPAQLNVGRLREALEFITANPRHWQQNVWARHNPYAGAAGEPELIGCLGYHITRLAGHRHGHLWGEETWSVADGRHMGEVACVEIGLSYEQAHELFHPGNSLEDLWDIAERITQGAITAPWRKKEKELAW